MPPAGGPAAALLLVLPLVPLGGAVNQPAEQVDNDDDAEVDEDDGPPERHQNEFPRNGSMRPQYITATKLKSAAHPIACSRTRVGVSASIFHAAGQTGR